MSNLDIRNKLIVSLISTIIICSCSNPFSSSNKNQPNDVVLEDSRDGQTYSTVKIGDQIWMKENLNYHVNESVCPYNKEGLCEKEGRLYSVSASMNNEIFSNKNPSGVQGICPTGWHLPSALEWIALGKFVAEQVGNENENTWAENQEIPNVTWDELSVHLSDSTFDNYGYYTSAPDTYGFSARMVGSYRPNTESFVMHKIHGYFRSSSRIDSTKNYYAYIDYSKESFGISSLSEDSYFSVRCIKDQ